ncbi:MAG: hypothetical protein ACP5JB_03410 [candidate division WOR-3 bacterium]|jgi:hypothetical protein
MCRIFLTALLGITPLLALDSIYVGRIDTIGGTTYDWQLCGPAKRMLVTLNPDLTTSLT